MFHFDWNYFHLGLEDPRPKHCLAFWVGRICAGFLNSQAVVGHCLGAWRIENQPFADQAKFSFAWWEWFGFHFIEGFACLTLWSKKVELRVLAIAWSRIFPVSQVWCAAPCLGKWEHYKVVPFFAQVRCSALLSFKYLIFLNRKIPNSLEKALDNLSTCSLSILCHH